MHKPNTTPDMKRARLSAFQNIRSGILFGKALEDVKQIERSIALFGMIMPIIVSQAKGSLVVMDGKKRLAALKRMAFAGTLPRSLVTIPYVFVDEAHKFGRRPVLALSSKDLFRAVMSLKAKSDDVDTIANKLYLCRASVEELFQLSHLSETVRKAFFRQDISFEQAHAFSTMPRKDAQTAVFMSVGPFATVNTILTTLKTYQMDHISLKARALEPSAISKLPDTQIPQNFIWGRAA